MKSAAYYDGWAAQRDGLPNESPYDEKTQAFSNHLWVSGWCDRHSTVKNETWDDVEDDVLLMIG